MANRIALINGTLITPFREIDDGFVLIKDESIEKIGKVGEMPIPTDARIIDVKGNYISPGFVDTHLHGAFGGSVMCCSEKDLQMMAEGLVRHGTTSFLPTTLSRSWDEIVQSVDCVTQVMRKNLNGSRILGVHLEGPYVNLEQKGAQNPDYIYSPAPEQYLPLLDKYPNIIRITAAPEVPGCLELGQELRRRNIVAAIGHSNASYQQIIEAVENGYSHVTHMFCAMSGLHKVGPYRISGVIESVLLMDELTAEIISDGHHLPPSLMELLLRTKGMDKVCLVTDSMSAAGLGPGNYELGGLDVVVESDVPDEFEIPMQKDNYVAKLTNRLFFASSVSTMDRLVRTMVKFVGLNIPQAVKLATYNPAKIQGLDDNIGILARNKRADIIVFEKNIEIKMTIVNGQILYNNL